MARRNQTFNVRWLDGSIIKIKNFEVRTVLDLKKRLEIEMGLPVYDQKIVIKGAIIKTDDSILNRLQIEQDQIINLLTIEPRKVHDIKQYLKKTDPKSITKTIKSEALPERGPITPTVKEVREHKTELKKQDTPIKQNPDIFDAGLLPKKYLKRIFALVFDKYQIFKDKRQQIVADEAYLDFFFMKVTEKNPFMRSLHREDTKILRDAFIEVNSSTISTKVELSRPEETKTIEQQLIENLVENDFDRSKSIKAAEIAENDVERALQILMNGQDQFKFQITPPKAEDEKFFIFRWFTHPQKKQLRLRLSLKVQNIYKYINSIKHRCPHFYKILCKHIYYVYRVINLPIKFEGTDNAGR